MNKHDVLIIGGGISGLSALHYLKRMKPELSCALIEKENRLGGTIGTDRIDGFSFDWGPNGFLDREPLTLELVDELGLTDQLERAGANVSNRFILRGGKLRSVPMSPPGFVTSDILPLMGKLRVFGEMWAKARPEGIDESVYDFVKRRIGRDAADYLVQPMVSGVYGGMAERLSLKSCFPIMREMEDEYGSLFKAMIAKAKKAKAAGKKSGSPSGPGGWLTSFRGGLSVIIDRFDELYSEQIARGSAVVSVSRDGERYLVKLDNDETLEAKHLILALPSYQAAKITTALSPKLSENLAAIEYAPIAVVCTGYKTENVGRDLNGFGFLVPSKEKLRILGSIWTSSIFENRAPEGVAQFRTMLGGDGDHESIELSEEQLLGQVRQDLGDILQLKGEPVISQVYRWRHGIPQFKIGHSERLEKIEADLKELPGVFVAGNAYYGIGLNDCVKQSFKVVSSF